MKLDSQIDKSDATDTSAERPTSRKRALGVIGAVGTLAYLYNMARGRAARRERRTLVGSAALIGAGVAVGAGANLLLTSVTGRDMRKKIVRSITSRFSSARAPVTGESGAKTANGAHAPVVEAEPIAHAESMPSKRDHGGAGVIDVAHSK